MANTPGYQDRLTAVFALADAQAGYFTAQQAVKLGFDYPVQHHHKRSGAWTPAGHGLYRLRDYPITPNEQLARLTLWSRNRQGDPQAVVSHETALALHEVSDLLPEHIHLTVPRGFRKAPPAEVILHQDLSPDFAPLEVEERHGFRLTSLQQTLLDLANRDFNPEYLLQAIDVATAQGRLSGSMAAAVREDVSKGSFRPVETTP